MPQKPIRIVTYGGLGDILLTTPAIKALKKKYPHRKIFIYGLNKAYMEIFENNPYVDKVRSTSFAANPIEYFLYRFRLAKFETFHYGRIYPNIFYKKSAMEIIGDVFNVEIQEKKVQLFVTAAEEAKAKAILSEYNNPVILHISSMTSKNQEWPLENWEALVEAMPGYTFIQLGLPAEAKVKNAVDLRGKTSFRESFALIKHAKGFAGINSSLSHVTNAFDIPGVVLFGPSPPVIWGHANNINMYKPLRCAPCVDLLFKEKCPYGGPCMTGITVEDVKEALLKQLSKEQYAHA